MNPSDHIEPSSSKVRKETGENEPVLNSHDVLETLLSIMKNMEINVVRSWHSKLHQPIRLQNNHIIQQYVKSFIIPKYLMDSIKGLTSSHVVKIAAFFEKQFYCESETFESYRTSSINFNQILTAFVNLIKLSRETYQKKKGIRFSRPAREEGSKEESAPILNVKEEPSNEKELDEPSNGPNRCSRVFILYALRKLRERARKGTIREVLTTDKEILNACVKETFHQCQNSSSLKDDHATYGGSCFSITDNSTYWTNGDQLLDWWVKNIENKQVLSLLVQNASYNGQRVKKFQKKHWSEAVIEVVTELKQLQHKDAEVTNSSIIKPVVSTESNKNSSSAMDYVQRSQVNTNSSSSSNTVNVGGISLTMPAEKLHHVFFLFQLHDALVNESSQILGFNENNTVFTINDIDTFTKVIMPKYFKDMTFDAFQNQLNQLHFSIMRNPNSCYYYQRLFQKNRKDLIQQIPDSSSTPLSTYSNDLASNANKKDQNQRSNTASIAPSNASSNFSLSAVGSTSQSANNPADFLLPNAITHLPVQQQIMQVQSQLIALIYNSILTNSLSNGAGGTPAWNNSALASLLPSIASAPVAFPLPEPYNSTQSFPGFQQGNFNAYNPWLNNFQPTLSGLYQHLQQQSTIPSVQSMPNNGNNLAQLGHNPSFGPLNAPYPSYAKANQTIPGNTALPATSNSLLPNSNLTPNNGMFHGAETLSSIQLPNLTNVTMASKMANEIAMNNGSSHLRLNQPSSNLSNASWYQQQKGLLGDMTTDSFNKNSYLRTYEPAKESMDAGSSDGLKVDVKSKKRSNAAANGSATASARASDDNSSEDASNPRNKRRKKASRTNSTTISDKILRSIPAPILSHALVQSSLAFNRSQQLDDDSELEEELHSLEPGEDEEEDEHRYRSGKNQKNSRRSSSGKKGTKEQDTLTTNTALKAAVKGSYEDIIDLRKVGRKRIFVDFTLKASQTSDTQHFPAALFTSVDASHPNNSSKEKNDDFICGFFHGKLIPNDECTIYKFGNVRSSSGRILGSGDDNNTYISNDGNGSFTSSSLASADRSEESRVGSEYQAEIPEFFSRKQLVQNRPKDIESNRVWLCSAIDEEELENIVEVLFERKKNWIPTVGLVYTIYFPNAEDGQSRYRLCAVLEALTVSSSARGRKSRGTSASFRVHDGKSEETITLDQFVRSLHKDEESLLDFIHEKQYDAEDVLENYDLDRIGSDEYESFHFKWTMKEVEQFLIGFRKYHEIRRIWQVYFQSSKTYQEIVKFYHDIHPYLMDNRIEAFMTMYYYAEAAKLQVPVETYLDNSTILGTASKNFPISVIEGGAYSTRSRRQYMKSSNIEEALNPPTSNSAVNSKPNPAAGVATTKQVPSLARNNDKYPTIIASNGHFGTLSLVFDTNYIFPERGTRNQQPSSQGKDGKGKTNNSSSSQVDERSLPIATYFGRRMFCICRTPINDTDRYIRCKVAKPSNCNGWVHMTCAGFGHLIDATVKKQPSKFREYICVKCKETLENEVVTKDDSTEQD